MPDQQRDSHDGSQRVLVTGATSGMGRAIAQQLAADGLRVIVHGRDAGRGAQVVEGIEWAGGQASFAAADLADPAAIKRLADAAGEIDVLVNNAGFSWFGATADLEPDRFDALFASNVRAPYFLVAAFAPGMAARGSGSIINISSMAGRIGLAAAAAYGATKGALESLTRAWAAEVSASGAPRGPRDRFTPAGRPPNGPPRSVPPHRWAEPGARRRSPGWSASSSRRGPAISPARGWGPIAGGRRSD